MGLTAAGRVEKELTESEAALWGRGRWGGVCIFCYPRQESLLTGSKFVGIVWI